MEITFHFFPASPSCCSSSGFERLVPIPRNVWGQITITVLVSRWSQRRHFSIHPRFSIFGVRAQRYLVPSRPSFVSPPTTSNVILLFQSWMISLDVTAITNRICKLRDNDDDYGPSTDCVISDNNNMGDNAECLYKDLRPMIMPHPEFFHPKCHAQRCDRLNTQ